MLVFFVKFYYKIFLINIDEFLSLLKIKIVLGWSSYQKFILQCC